jgi:hypothetical protein
LKLYRNNLFAKARPQCPGSVLPVPSYLPKRHSSDSTQPRDADRKPEEKDVFDDKGPDIRPDGKLNLTPRNANRQKSQRDKKARGGYIVPIHLQSLTTLEIETKLQDTAKKSPSVYSAMQKLQHLIQDRKIEPSARHYKWLIQCHSDPQHGSPNLVRQLLLEMEQNDIPLDSGTLHAALQVCTTITGHTKFIANVLRPLQFIQIIRYGKMCFVLCEIDGFRSVPTVGTMWWRA